MKHTLEQVPSYVLLDLNGEPSDEHKVHFSESDLIQYALPITKGGTKYLGTHLSRNKKSRIDQLEYTVPGMKIEISTRNFD
jgi:hypothetical protein